MLGEKSLLGEGERERLGKVSVKRKEGAMAWRVDLR